MLSNVVVNWGNEKLADADLGKRNWSHMKLNLPFACWFFNTTDCRSWYLIFYKETAPGPMFWGTDFMRHLHKNCEISSWIELSNSTYISIQYSVHLEIRMVSFDKKQESLVLPILPIFIVVAPLDILTGMRGYEWNINATKLSFSSVHWNLCQTKAVHRLINIFLHFPLLWVPGLKCGEPAHHHAFVLSCIPVVVS